MSASPLMRRARAFTLVELLVVIGIISLLIGILLPALSRAKRAAQTAYCLANLRTIGQAMVMYTAENKGWLPGSGWTSGAQFWNQSGSPLPTKNILPTNNCPAVNESCDWIGPLARQMGIKNAAIDGIDSIARFQAYRSLGWMICPAYTEMPVGPRSGSADAGIGQGLSYCTTLAFVCRSRDTFGSASLTGHTELNGNLLAPPNSSGNPIITIPTSYGPRLSKVANSSEKVYVADGARTVIPSSVSGPLVEQPPVYVISGDPGSTAWSATSYCDIGAFGGWTHSAYRTAVPNNANVLPSKDIRIWAYRHGTLTPFKKAGSYRMNVAYFDGHAETLDEVTAANPGLWMPTGSVINPIVGCTPEAVAGTKTVWTDVVARYCPGVTTTTQTWTSP